MQYNILSKMRSLKLRDGCWSTQVYAINNNSDAGEENLRRPNNRSLSNLDLKIQQTNFLQEYLLPYGLPTTNLLEPQIEPCLKFVDFVETLADVYRRNEGFSEFDKSLGFLEQCAIFRGINEPKLFRRALQFSRQHAIDVHSKVVLSAWLRFERRENEFIGASTLDCSGKNIECPKASLISGYDPESVYDHCVCCRKPKNGEEEEECSTSNEDFDMSFIAGDEEVRCIRYQIASLSKPFNTLLYGNFVESSREKINFTKNDISAKALRALELYSRTKKVDSLDPNIVLELLSLANKFCCDELKFDCDVYLSSLVTDTEIALMFIEYGLEESAYLLVAACLQVFLRELPGSLHNERVMKYFCSYDASRKLAMARHSSFQLYFFLSQTSIEEDMKSNTSVMLLERLAECATLPWQKQLAFHQMGCVMYERKEFKDAQHWFEASFEMGHSYSLVGVARSKFKRGHKYTAYKQMTSLISGCCPTGWMYQERSLYCVGKEKMADLEKATELDPTLPFPYKYRAVAFLEERKFGAAISEINKIISFKVSPDCLELRACFSILLEDYEAALRDIRALLTLEPGHMMFQGKVHGEQLLELLRPQVPQWSQADC